MRVAIVGAIMTVSIGAIAAAADKPAAKGESGAGKSTELDADRAFANLTRICDLGPRISGSEGMDRQQRLISEKQPEVVCRLCEAGVLHLLDGQNVVRPRRAGN